MKHKKHDKEATVIGNDSYALIHYNQLPSNTSVRQQVEALKADQHWQDLHQIEISHRIDALIADIEGAKP